MQSQHATDPQAATDPEWTSLGLVEEFKSNELKQVRAGEMHLVVARTAGGEVHVLDNRCPHEGYPLSQGTLKGNALTCCWHNWKFDVTSGACTLGEEGVRRFPVRVRDGIVEVDLAQPDASAVVPGLLASLDQGIKRQELGRIARDGVRLLQAGVGPWDLLAHVARYDAVHAEYGTTHALAAAADCGRLLEHYPGTQAMLAVMPAFDMCAEANRRLPARRAPGPIAGGDGDSLRVALESEDVERAEGLLRGALEAGVSRARIERWLYRAMSDHFTDFGHHLIYMVKAQELIQQVGDEVGEETMNAVYPALLHSLGLATREDTLPYMRPYTEFLSGIKGELKAVWALRRPDASFDGDGLRDAVLDGRSEEALGALWDALQAGVQSARIARVLVAAAAHRLMRYDPRIEWDEGVAENFLWATHRFTFASAVRNAVERFEEPDSLRFLFQAVAFIHSGRALDAQLAERTPIECETATPASVVEAMRAGNPTLAVARANGFLQAGEIEPLRLALEEFCLSDPIVRPIAVTHVIKTVLAALEEWRALDGSPDRAIPILAAVRTFSLPLVERRVQATVRTSLRWVVEGEVPRKLTQ